MAKIAAIDMGSNAIRFYAVETAGDSSYRVLENVREPIRLGGDVFLTGAIREENIRKAEAAFRRFRQLLRAHGVQTVRAVATCATREASNADLLLSRLERASGIRVEVINGDEEARLIALAVGKKISLGKKSALIVDLGGGSVEITFVENGRITLTDSHNFGAVRLLDMLSSAEEDLRSAGQLLNEYMELISRKLSRRGDGKRATLFIATGGNVESIAAIPGMHAEPHPDYPDTVRIKAGNLRRLMEELSGMSLKSRMERFGLREDRADVILPACFVYHRIAELNGSEEILVPRVSLKDGVIQEILEQGKGAEHLLDLREQVGVSCRELMARYKLDQKHAEKVADLVLSLFDQTEQLHGLGKQERIYLEAAALLHDIGYFISMQKHHKHSHYIIANSGIVGLSPLERLVVAGIARYHRKATPGANHPELEALPKRERDVVRALSSMLRIADALDKEHAGAIRSIDCKLQDGTLLIRAASKKSCRLEALGIMSNASMFREHFGVDVRLTIEPEG
ncbi:MAG: Ppx/GppA phosphatase family protein [Candidatus Deferrimicrobium sp.]|nr:Ppx/GppA phosphatase family protein [Candidatus Deferrimicrobium sp.]